VLRRCPVRVARGRPEGGYTAEFEIICRDCGDDPDLDYRQVSPDLQRLRGPLPLAAAVAAYEQHVQRHLSPQDVRGPQDVRLPGRRVRHAGRGSHASQNHASQN